MNLSIFTLFITFSVWAKPTILISYFDAFGGAPFNNSATVAQDLRRKFTNHPKLEIKFCALNTVFDKSLNQLEACINQLTQPPMMILGLGEAICDLKVETMARNKDKTFAPDNEGNERNGQIVKNGVDFLGLRYPLHEMYCALNSNERNQIVISNDAGGFVCNNLMYQMSHIYSDFQFGFIHVPAHNCENLQLKNEVVTKFLQKMLIGLIEAFEKPAPSITLPHWENQNRLPVEKDDIKYLQQQTRDNECLQEFTEKLKPRDFWNWFRNLKHHN
jgi:pyrrolidone-carboxylate peptidase